MMITTTASMLFLTAVIGFSVFDIPPAPTTTHVEAWLREHSVALDPLDAACARFVQATRDARVIGLGEATHGQHEAFELKRKLTMALVADGLDVIAFEASATAARSCDDYISGRSDDINLGMRGLGMSIWNIEENEALLRDLRAWNDAHQKDGRVRFVGVDVQDSQATCARIKELLGTSAGDLGDKFTNWISRLEPAIGELWSGKPEAYEKLGIEFAELEGAAKKLSDAPELALRLAELGRARSMFHSAGGRDRAMAEMLLLQLAPDERAVVWAHDLHVTRGPLEYAQSQDLGMGGCLAETLGKQYYALGIAFGEGGFQALEDAEPGKFRMRTFTVHPAPEGSLEATLARAFGRDSFLDLRAAPTQGPVAEWLDAAHPFRWFGGYRIPAGIEEPNQDPSTWQRSILRRDFDGIVYLAKTTAAHPRAK